MADIKDLLAQKVTTKEQFDEILATAEGTLRCSGRYRSVYDYLAHARDRYDRRLVDITRNLRPLGERGVGYHPTRWWLLRNHLRMTLNGVEWVSDAMLPVVTAFPELCIHMNPAETPDDPSLVWYTPDPQSGERDAPARTTLARLIRKLYPQVADDTIRDIDAAHRAETNNELEIIPPAQIAEMYQLGPESCMSHRPSRWPSALGHHPTEVYNAPGFGLALGRKGDRINARCLVWVNPEDSKDKRYVRNYGDPSLERRLIRAGYRMAGLDGARIKRIDLEGAAAPYQRVLMPYIDYPGGKPGEKAGRTILFDGDEYLRIVGDTDEHPVRVAVRRVARGVGFFTAAGTSGVTDLYAAMSMVPMEVTCALTGRAFSLVDVAPVTVLVDGAIKYAHPDADFTGMKRLWTVGAEGVREEVYCPADAPTVEDAGKVWLRSPATMEHLGFRLLDAALYGADSWESRTRTAPVVHEGRAANIRLVDAVHYVTLENGAPRLQMLHKASLPPTKGLVRLHRFSATHPAWAAKGLPTVKTVSGRTVVPGAHNVTQMYDGRWDFDAKLTRDPLLGQYLAKPKGSAPLMYQAAADALRAALKATLDRTLQAALSAFEDYLEDFDTAERLFWKRASSFTHLQRQVPVRRDGDSQAWVYASCMALGPYTAPTSLVRDLKKFIANMDELDALDTPTTDLPGLNMNADQIFGVQKVFAPFVREILQAADTLRERFNTNRATYEAKLAHHRAVIAAQPAIRFAIAA